jgi:hypothetical protein
MRRISAWDTLRSSVLANEWVFKAASKNYAKFICRFIESSWRLRKEYNIIQHNSGTLWQLSFLGRSLSIVPSAQMFQSVSVWGEVEHDGTRLRLGRLPEIMQNISAQFLIPPFNTLDAEDFTIFNDILYHCKPRTPHLSMCKVGFASWSCGKCQRIHQGLGEAGNTDLFYELIQQFNCLFCFLSYSCWNDWNILECTLRDYCIWSRIVVPWKIWKLWAISWSSNRWHFAKAWAFQRLSKECLRADVLESQGRWPTKATSPPGITRHHGPVVLQWPIREGGLTVQMPSIQPQNVATRAFSMVLAKLL